MRNSILSIALTMLAVVACTESFQSVAACETSGSCQTNDRARYGYVQRAYVLRGYIPSKATIRRNPSVQQPSASSDAVDLDAGASYRLTGGGYGVQLGNIVLSVGSLELDCDVLTWSDGEVTFQVPPLKMKRPTSGELHVVASNGRSVSSKPIRFRGIVVQQRLPVEPVAPHIKSVEPLESPVVSGSAVISDSEVISEPAVAPSSQPFDLGQGLE